MGRWRNGGILMILFTYFNISTFCEIFSFSVRICLGKAMCQEKILKANGFHFFLCDFFPPQDVPSPLKKTTSTKKGRDGVGNYNENIIDSRLEK